MSFIRTILAASTLAASALALVASATTAAAADPQTAAWGSVGGWQIRVDRTVGNGCFASQAYRDGTGVRLGFNMSRKIVYLLFGNPNWRSIEAGKLYHLEFVFDDAVRYSGDLRGVRFGDYVFLDGDNLTYNFTRDFMQRSTLRISYRGAQISYLSLHNTYAAVAEVMHCQQEMAGAGSGTGSQYRNTVSPFAGTSSGPIDPFSR